MKLLDTIEYVLLDGKVVFEPKLLNGEVMWIDVEWEAEPYWENDGIGSYEYWGQKSFDAGTDYVSLEDYGNPIWDESKHTTEENTIIKLFADSPEIEKVCDRFCDLYRENQIN